MTKKELAITTEFITLGALLKFAGFIQKGSDAAVFLCENKVFVNGEHETRRGRKIYPGYELNVNKQSLIVVIE